MQIFGVCCSFYFRFKLIFAEKIPSSTMKSYPVYVTNEMPDMDAGNKPILFGDFSYFWIGERGKRSVKRLVERYADHGQVAYITSERVDAKLVLSEAVKCLEVNA